MNLHNQSASRFHGWKRVVVDQQPPHLAGKCEDGTKWVVAGQLTPDTWAVDVWVVLEMQELRSIKLEGEKWEFTPTPLPPNMLDWFGGPPTIEGVPMAWIEHKQDGASLWAHFRQRTGSLLVIDMWVRWYADQPSVATGEIVVAASNPAVPDVEITLPFDLTFAWGSATVTLPAQRTDGALLRQGDMIGDGQARSLPFALTWTNRLQTPEQWQHAAAVASMMVFGHGCTNVWPSGQLIDRDPASIPGNSQRHLLDAISRVYTYDAGPLGVTAASTVSGAQEDQIYVGKQAGYAQGMAHVQARYLTALRQSLRPCHHLEKDGQHLDLSKHPSLVFWDGRPHWHHGVSPDRLGKPREPYAWELHNWWGPDVEHALCQTLSLAARLTGSDALQWQLEHWARIYQLQWTWKAGLSTSQPYAARAIGYEGLLVTNLHATLTNRDTAAQVVKHWTERLGRILVPALAGKWKDIWDVRQDDPRLGPGPWWIPWQQGLGCYGLWIASKLVGDADGLRIAKQAANRVVEDAWSLASNGRWVTKASMSCVDLSAGTADESFNLFGMSFAVAVVLADSPSHVKAASIWEQLQRDTKGDHPWLPPTPKP